MTWLAQVVAFIFEALLRAYGKDLGKRTASDAVKDKDMLVRAGARVRAWRDWVLANRARDGGGPDAGRP